MTVDQLALVMAREVLGEQPAEQLPAVATDALMEGLDSPSLRELAGARPTAWQDNRDLFLAAMAEMGMTLPSPSGARWRLVRHWATRIADGTVTPYEGARRICACADDLELPEELAPFVAAADEWEDNGFTAQTTSPLYAGPIPDRALRESIEAQIVKAARDLLGGGHETA